MARVLVVDDDLSVLEVMARTLRADGHTVMAVDSGIAALKVASEQAPDVAVMDLRMAPLDGISTTVRLKRLNSSTRVLCVSGYSPTFEEWDRALRAGFSGFLPKPFKLAEFSERVRDLLRRQQRESYGSRSRRLGSLTSASGGGTGLEVGSTSKRWATLIIAAINAPNDPRTIASWSRAVGSSRSTIQETCRLVGVKPRDARDLARILRAVIRGRQSKLEDELAIADHRTLRHFLDRAGIESGSDPSVTPRNVLERQHFVSQSLPCLRDLVGLVAAQE